MFNPTHPLYFCSCHSGFYGRHCEHYEQNWEHSYSNTSICRPQSDDQRPLCLCSLSRFGSSCHLRIDSCESNPCQNQGTCIQQYSPKPITDYACLCTELFQGEHWEQARGTVHLQIESKFNASTVAATTISYADTMRLELGLAIRHQQLYHYLPSHVTLIYNQRTLPFAPVRGILKLYKNSYPDIELDYYILYHTGEKITLNVTVDLTAENHCPLVDTFWHLLNTSGAGFNSTTAVFSYHRLCQAQAETASFRCFRDPNYICICTADFSRADCSLYNHSSDQCSVCLAKGYFVQGALDNSTDFLCLCSRCHSGKQCQYSNEFLSYTLDSLMITDLQEKHKLSTGIYVLIAVLIFFIGLFNNLCSFVTFSRRKPCAFGVGIYLLAVSIADQCSLLLLVLKIIHVILGSDGNLFPYAAFNGYSCRIISYALSVFTRLTYWLTSFVALERLFVTLFPTSTLLKTTRLPIVVTLSTILIVSTMHLHEAWHYTTIADHSYPSTNVTLCVTSYTESVVSTYNRVNIVLHYIVPFLIQIISITLMIIRITCSRARSAGHNRPAFGKVFQQQFQSQKELYITPLIIVLSLSPQLILAFSFVCTELRQTWQRYLLLTAYFLSYLPQILGFLLYVLPSTTFSNEFRQTMIGKRVLGRQNEIRRKR